MRQYRIKEQNGYFYPQYKEGWKTLWFWENFNELGSTVYAGTDFYDGWKNRSEYTRWLFKTKKKAEEFIENDKLETTIIYHN